MVSVEIFGGISFFIFDWSIGEIVESLVGLVVGEYSLIFIDQVGCFDILQFLINSLDFFMVELLS